MSKTVKPSLSSSKQKYKSLCEQPFAMSVSQLEDTKKFLKSGKPELVSMIEATLSNLIPFPPKHTAEPMSAHCIVECTKEQAEQITQIFFEAEADSISSSGEPTEATGTLVRLVNSWAELEESFQQT